MLHIRRLPKEKCTFRTLILVSTHCPFQTFAILFSFVVAIANLLLISGLVFPFACNLAPRYSKLLTLSISSLSIFITASSLHPACAHGFSCQGISHLKGIISNHLSPLSGYKPRKRRLFPTISPPLSFFPTPSS